MAPFKDRGVTAFSPRTAGGSDHLSFDVVGLPSLHFIQDPIDEAARHSNIDVFDRLQIPDLLQNAVIVASVIYHAANRPDPLPRKPLPPPNPSSAFPQVPRR